jgi:NAD(P)H-flavin reductase
MLKFLFKKHFSTKTKLTFNYKAQIAKNSYVLRFLLPDNNTSLGFKTCQHIMIESEVPELGKTLAKPFQPISDESDKGFIDILVRVYPKIEGNKDYGAFSNHLISLEEGQVVSSYGPFGNIAYNGKGEIEHNGVKQKFTKIGLIAGGSGITPMFQLINKVLTNKSDKTALSLIYATRHPDEICFIDDLVKYDIKGRFHFYPVCNVVDNNWKFGSGIIQPYMIDNLMPVSSGKFVYNFR